MIVAGASGDGVGELVEVRIGWHALRARRFVLAWLSWGTLQTREQLRCSRSRVFDRVCRGRTFSTGFVEVRIGFEPTCDGFAKRALAAENTQDRDIPDPDVGAEGGGAGSVGQSWGNSGDYDTLLTAALRGATADKDWELVAMLARRLEERRAARALAGVVDLESERAKRAAKPPA